MSELIDVTVKMPKPPEGWEWDCWRPVKDGEPFLTLNGGIVIATPPPIEGDRIRLCCRRIVPPYQFPANMVDGATVYPCGDEWYVTTGQVGPMPDGWASPKNVCYMAATIFADFVPPPERRPYTKGKA